MNITHGKKERCQRITIYGPEGIGKSTLAAQFPAPLFLDVEDGTAHLDVRRAGVDNWTGLLDAVNAFAAIASATPGEYGTLVIDTIDAAESLCHQHTCLKAGKSGIEDFGYGKGYRYAAENMSVLLKALDGIIVTARCNVVLLAHSHLRKFEQPDEAGAYDRYELKLHKVAASAVKEWSDAVLFANYETYVIDVDGTKKAKGGKRVIHTTHNPCWDAKNRHGLAEKLPLAWDAIAEMVPATTPAKPAEKQDAAGFPALLWELMERDGITEQELRDINAARGYYGAEVSPANYSTDHVDRLVTQWEAVKGLIRDARKKQNKEG